ncbi:hypothetical protein ElyMa_003827700 [Elysia marginata]|uniref:Uncharacterized protein n=1 Tax=Elysia marginata TaxID=1093978 RepID=A0AAV4FF00_9GAST|nr:hypothetical protein ElyMa_003827700 [Elysia marginata]
MKTVCEGRLDGRRRKGRPLISLVTNLTTACGLSLHQIVQKSQDRAGWQQKVRSSIATANTASGDADRKTNAYKLKCFRKIFNVTRRGFIRNKTVPELIEPANSKSMPPHQPAPRACHLTSQQQEHATTPASSKSMPPQQPAARACHLTSQQQEYATLVHEDQGQPG